MSRFNEVYAEPVADTDGGAAAVSAELYDLEQAVRLFSEYYGEIIQPDQLIIEWAHFHGEYYDDEFINTWWRRSENKGEGTPMVDMYENKKGARKLWVVNSRKVRY